MYFTQGLETYVGSRGNIPGEGLPVGPQKSSKFSIFAVYNPVCHSQNYW